MLPAPATYMLDTNAFDELALSEGDRRRVVALIRSGAIELFTTYVQEAELFEVASRKPEKYWRIASIPRAVIPASVFVVGHSPLGAARLGQGWAYDQVRRGARHVDDGVIADTARAEGMTLVTNEKRLQNRAAEIGVITIRPSELVARLRML